MRFEMDELMHANGELKKKLEDETQMRIKLQEEIYKNLKTHEEEV